MQCTFSLEMKTNDFIIKASFVQNFLVSGYQRQDCVHRKLTKQVEKTVEQEKLLVMSNFSFSHSVFKRLVLQTGKNKGMFWKWLIYALPTKKL